ncbi:adenylyl-sulfate kinase [Palleronia sediminis]|uniref:Adenylyl-sulfate kinase n=1 Tax=Palleronia sediminis TaxID=2547833 RepID=A0A4R6A941_9RHOB|nr:adenylyl-sulfate kinase [Palleronia sediminis]TDL79405.1 adenylyl-sulfate kinase [Palleronia sediminis]
MVIWIVGLSGAGKTTLAEAVVAHARRTRPDVVLVDGDAVRAAFGDDLGHSMADRRRNAERMMGLCLWLEGQGFGVVCAILSLFPEHRAEMRTRAAAYREVFVDAPVAQLRARDGKGLYARFDRGEIRDVAGLDLPFPAPEAPDLTIRNDGPPEALLAHVPALAGLLTGAGVAA